MNYKIDTNMIPRANFLRVCLSCWSRLPAKHQDSVPKLICSQECGLHWSRSLTTPGSSSILKKYGDDVGHSRRFYSSDDVNEAAEQVLQNPYFNKYKEKLQKLQSESPEEFNKKLGNIQQKIIETKEKRKKDLTEKPAEKKSTGLGGSWPPKNLDEVMKVDLLHDRTSEEIQKLWTEYHVDRDCVFGVVKEVEYEYLMEKAKVCPVFVYPLHRNDGYEFFLSQFSGKDIYFTPLIMYQTQKENAVSCLTIAHFPDLKDEKGIVLMAGQHDKNLLTKEDALNLVRQMTMYYSVPGAERFNLVRVFNHMPENFNYQDIISEYKKMQLFLEKPFFDS